ncbi:TetR/AcrR family transcriptional regulator [Streptomyces syringium]|uniref:TetR/AcrR family transcriptional regulator n=1 Tax=Streptomyces syringium TaxID=76729 RepID=UPI0033E1AA2B
MQTRAALVRAAAAMFDRHGYDGTALSTICKEASISMGALTFHFSSKAELAEVVEAEGRATIQTTVDQAAAGSGPALSKVVGMTLELTRLLETHVLARSACRLARERPGSEVAWTSPWLPTVRRLLDEAHHSGQLHGAAGPADVTQLVEYLVRGAESHLRDRFATEQECESAADRLERVWRFALTRVEAAQDRGHQARPSGR